MEFEPDPAEDERKEREADKPIDWAAHNAANDEFYRLDEENDLFGHSGFSVNYKDLMEGDEW